MGASTSVTRPKPPYWHRGITTDEVEQLVTAPNKNWSFTTFDVVDIEQDKVGAWRPQLSKEKEAPRAEFIKCARKFPSPRAFASTRFDAEAVSHSAGGPLTAGRQRSATMVSVTTASKD